MTTVRRRSPHYSFPKFDTPGTSRYDRKRTRKARRASNRVPTHEALTLLAEEAHDTADADQIADSAHATGRMSK